MIRRPKIMGARDFRQKPDPLIPEDKPPAAGDDEGEKKPSPAKGTKRSKSQLAAYLKRKAKNKGMLAESQSDSEDI